MENVNETIQSEFDPNFNKISSFRRFAPQVINITFQFIE